MKVLNDRFTNDFSKCTMEAKAMELSNGITSSKYEQQLFYHNCYTQWNNLSEWSENKDIFKGIKIRKPFPKKSSLNKIVKNVHQEKKKKGKWSQKRGLK